MEKLKLSKPYMLDGKAITEIDYDFDKLTGQDLINAERGLDTGTIAIVCELNKQFQSNVFATASNMNIYDVRRLPAKDFVRVTNLVNAFLMGGSDDANQSPAPSDESVPQ